jgi:hypothetical protein
MRQASAAGLIGLALGGPARADFDPATLDLAALIECKADIKTYNGFAIWLMEEPDAAAKLGRRKLPPERTPSSRDTGWEFRSARTATRPTTLRSLPPDR